MSNTDKLITPFGEIIILVDGASFPYQADKGKSTKEFCPDEVREEFLSYMET